MAITNYDRVGKALDLLKSGLAPFVERELKAQHAQRWLELARHGGALLGHGRAGRSGGSPPGSWGRLPASTPWGGSA